ncbi:MAG TPA: type II toxin-antitoxin system prevent-host-death family antitoxin [Candidatus Polarisedimenticolaceae bacterium]|nr:type II toxin-antitoxin system prevent-host-death family antitoxin [Candidatus Polarisedimenticolaceae bacterium]
MRLGLREANQKFSKAIQAVKQGKEVVLTERGRAIAVIKPIAAGNDESAVIRRLEAEGVLRPAEKRRPMPDIKPIRIKGKALSATVREDRNED